MRLSLLRSPKNPDPEADMGHHRFRYALLPHQGTLQQANVIHSAFNFNVPLLVANDLPVTLWQDHKNSFFSVDHDSVIIDAVKKAEDSNDIIVRLYESFGGRTKFNFKSCFPIKSAHLCNMLEEKLEESTKLEWNEGQVSLSIKPFQVITLALSL